VAADPSIDAVIVIYIPPLEHDAPPVADAIIASIDALARPIPVLTCFMSARGVPEQLSRPGVRIPSYAYPEQAAIALAHAADHGAWRMRPESATPTLLGIREDEAHAVIAGALARGDEGWLTHDEVSSLLDCYGLPSVRSISVAAAEDAVEAAGRIGAPIALKAAGPLHKTDVQAVRLDVAPADVLEVAQAMGEHLRSGGHPLEGFVVQEMVHDAAEMLVGVVVDPIFGPVIAVGSGGVTVELTRDIAVRVAPLTDLDAREMVRELVTFPLLDGFRGATPKDVGALEDVILRVGALADDHPEITEMDCNPVMVLPRGAAIVDARIRVRLAEPEPRFVARAGE
jgi:acyl-CoA synthetase (NDP forming)